MGIKVLKIVICMFMFLHMEGVRERVCNLSFIVAKLYFTVQLTCHIKGNLRHKSNNYQYVCRIVKKSIRIGINVMKIDICLGWVGRGGVN